MPVVGYCRNLHNNLCPCFVCCKKFSLDNGVEDLLTHICFTHHIVIENIDCIADFKKYMEYYVKRHSEAPLESFTKQIVIEVPEKDAEPREQKYYLLGNLPEDEALRKDLHAQRLKAAQKQQKKDLSHEYYIRHCFYCHQTLEVTNSQLVNHLRSHGFQLGHPERLVYIERFVEAIEDTFRNLHCLYCELEFESCRALVTHMEEKGHLKIHPNNHFYDQFYMINYLEYGKTWLDFVKEKSQADADQESTKADDDTDWSSWGTEPECIMCLFCQHMCRSWEGTLLHIQVSHNFDFKASVSHLRFYQQVKVVNYIRRRILNGQCINCEFVSEDANGLVDHMESSNHLTIPEQECWNHSEYLFCSMENDMFLYHLEDQEDENDNKEYLMEMKETPDILHQVVINSESESTRSSLSQETCSNRSYNAISSVGEDEGDFDSRPDVSGNCNSNTQPEVVATESAASSAAENDVKINMCRGDECDREKWLSNSQPEVVSTEKAAVSVAESENDKKAETCRGDMSLSAAHVGAGDSAPKNYSLSSR